MTIEELHALKVAMQKDIHGVLSVLEGKDYKEALSFYVDALCTARTQVVRMVVKEEDNE